MGKRRTKSDDEGTQIEVGTRGAVLALVAVLAVFALVAYLMVGREDGGTPGGVAPGAAVPAPTGSTGTAGGEPGTWLTADGDPAIGSRDAPVTIVEYSDYQCPNCRQFATEVLPWLKQSWLRDGVVNVVYRDYAIRGDESYLAAEAAHCAGEQGRYWSFHDALFAAQSGENQGAFSTGALAAMAAALGLDADAFGACLASGRHRARVESSTRGAFDAGFEGTPTYVVNGHQTQGAIDVDRWGELFALFMQEFAEATRAAAP